MGRHKERKPVKYHSTQSEKDIIKAAAAQEGLSVNVWMRRTLGLRAEVPEHSAGGRPPLPDDMIRSAISYACMTAGERKKLQDEAERQSLTIQGYMQLKVQRKLGLRT